MTDKTHQMIGVTAAVGLFFVQYPERPLSIGLATTVIVASMVGSVAPDIDQPTGKLWRRIPLGGFFGRITAAALGGHRNLSHSILGVFLFSAAAYGLLRLVPATWLIDIHLAWQAFCVGFIFHLLADSVTVMGIPLFWPFGGYYGIPPKPFHGIRIQTGEWFENLIVFPFTFVILGAIIFSHASAICNAFGRAC